jgi:hypothetical protein
VAYQVYLSQPWPKDQKPVSKEKYLPLPIDGKKATDIEKQKNVRAAALKKLENEKNGKRT